MGPSNIAIEFVFETGARVNFGWEKWPCKRTFTYKESNIPQTRGTPDCHTLFRFLHRIWEIII